jgi:hypothetical protein
MLETERRQRGVLEEEIVVCNLSALGERPPFRRSSLPSLSPRPFLSRASLVSGSPKGFRRLPPKREEDRE